MPHVILTMAAIGVALIVIGLQPGPWLFGITVDDMRHPPTGVATEWWSEAEVRPDNSHEVRLPGAWRRRVYGRIAGRTANWRHAQASPPPEFLR